MLGGIEPGHYYLNVWTQTPFAEVNETGPSRVIATTFYPDATERESARLIEIHPGQEINGILIRQKTERLFHVQGHLDGIEKPQIFVFPEVREDEGGGVPIRLDADGSFEFSARAGKYVVSGTGVLKPENKSPVYVNQPLVLERDIDDFVVHASDKDLVNGIVHDENGKFPGFVNGQGAFGLDSLVSRWWGQGFRVDPTGVLHGKSDGTNTLITGYVRALFYGFLPEYSIESVRFNGNDVTNRTFILQATGGTFEVSLRSGAANISGIVRNEKGGMPDEALVTIWSTEEPPDGARGFSATLAVYRGEFTFEHLPPGGYAIAAWEGIDDGTAAYPGFYRQFEGSAVRLKVGRDAHENVSVVTVSRDIAQTQAAKLK